MKFEQPERLTPNELSTRLNSRNPAAVSAALVSASRQEPDRLQVETLIERFSRHDDSWIRGVTAISAGHVARIHRELTSDRIVLLIRVFPDNSLTSGKAKDALAGTPSVIGRVGALLL